MKKVLKFWDIILTGVLLIVSLILPYPSTIQSIFGVLTVLSFLFIFYKRALSKKD